MLSQATIYGVDDRLDVYEAPESFARVARESAVAMIAPERLADHGDSTFRISAPTLREAFSLCDSERFIDQPAAANCSGVLIGADVVATSAHCLPADGGCGTSRYVFGYHVERAGQPIIIDHDAVGSGSGVFDTDGKLVGILARGGRDFAYDDVDGCSRAHIADPSNADEHEEATQLDSVTSALDASLHNSDLATCRSPACDLAECSADHEASADGASCSVDSPGASHEREKQSTATWWGLTTMFSLCRFRSRCRRALTTTAR